MERNLKIKTYKKKVIYVLESNYGQWEQGH